MQKGESKGPPILLAIILIEYHRDLALEGHQINLKCPLVLCCVACVLCGRYLLRFPVLIPRCATSSQIVSFVACHATSRVFVGLPYYFPPRDFHNFVKTKPKPLLSGHSEFTVNLFVVAIIWISGIRCFVTCLLHCATLCTSYALSSSAIET